jgi:hypothetical protein
MTTYRVRHQGKEYTVECHHSKGYHARNPLTLQIVQGNPTATETARRTARKVHYHVRRAASSAKKKATSAYRTAVKGTWFQKHGKTLIIGTAAAVTVGAVVFFVAEVLDPNLTNTACSTLQNQLVNLYADIGAINKQAGQAGAFTSAQTAQINSLQSQVNGVLANITSTCTPSPGQTMDEFLQTVAGYAAVAAAVFLGLIEVGITIIVGVLAYKFLNRFVFSKSNPNNLPKSLEDTQVADDFNVGSVGDLLGQASVMDSYAKGNITIEQATQQLQTLGADDPTIGQAYAYSSYFAELAGNATDADVAEALTNLATAYDQMASGDAEQVSQALAILEGEE